MTLYSVLHGPSVGDQSPESARLRWFVEVNSGEQSTVAALERGLDCPIRLWWPTPFRRPVIMESPSYRDSMGARECFPLLPEVFTAGHTHVSPILFTKGLNRNNPWLHHALDGLRARWVAQEQSLQDTMFHLWNSIWLHIYQGEDKPEDIFALLIENAYQLSGAPVIYVAARRDSADSIQTVKNQGIVNPHFGFRLKVGYGVGGYVTQSQRSVMIPDYRSSSLRDTTVTALIDDEGILSGTIVPWCIPTGLDGVLYVTHRQPKQVSPRDASILEHFVRALGPVYLSALDSRHRNKQFPKPQGQQVSAILAKLRSARQQESISIFSEVTQALKLSVSLADEWGQAIFDSIDTPLTRPSLQVRIGVDPYWGKLSLWNDDSNPIYPSVWPDFVETAAILLATMQAKAWKDILHQSQWFRSMLQCDPQSAKSLWEDYGSCHMLPQFQQIVGIQCLNSTHGWPLNTVLSLNRYLTNKFHGVLFAEEHWLWSLIPQARPDAIWQNLWRLLSHDHGLPCQMSSVSTIVSADTLQTAVSQIREWTRSLQSSSQGGYYAARVNNVSGMLNAIDSQHLENMVQHWLGPLLHHDSTKDLIDTLYHYLATGSISATAEQLFLHPNTVRYRLAKICDALEISNLEDISIRENLWLASKFWRFRQ
ncbi:MAG: hypothetical protein C7B46_17570 [Sulfobacillus benefaciens]|uniref:PucR C-terminal helix-turn-helix domain-containing protein n=1 Tax=Sulfobacillus benefaciens TaxID=453960 RepID=A0A2T2X8P2_9FIRM|nr:MAG: hypothetical protein C7B46_17570 [Sulfobacillus benefaciens]